MLAIVMTYEDVYWNTTPAKADQLGIEHLSNLFITKHIKHKVTLSGESGNLSVMPKHIVP